MYIIHILITQIMYLQLCLKKISTNIIRMDSKVLYCGKACEKRRYVMVMGKIKLDFTLHS